MDTVKLKAILESLVFVSEFPVRAARLAEASDSEPGLVLRLLRELVAEYQTCGRGLQLVEVADGFQFRTPMEHMEWVRRLSHSRPFRFSRAALETLAIIAYRQPITRVEVEYLRGVDSGGVVKTLLDKHLVRILGKKDIPGRPLIYGTTREFLELFGLRDLAALPTLKEFSELPLEPLAEAVASADSPAENIAEDDEE